MRRHDWAERLGQVLRAAQTRAYAFGEHDCALHACDGALAITGADPGAAYRGKYKTYLAGMRMLKRRSGCDTLEAWADSLWPRTPAALARRGDWALAEAPADAKGTLGLTMTIVDGPMLVGPEGVRLPLSAAIAAWKVD